MSAMRLEDQVKLTTPISETDPRAWIRPQAWERYTAEEHATWLFLHDRQIGILAERACPEFMAGLKALDLRGAGVPDFEDVSARLRPLTGWTIAPVEGLVPDEAFFGFLAERRFPAGSFIRQASSLDYIEAPDVFHDVFGHVPMLTNPAFADFMQAYGEAGLRAARQGRIEALARLYWFTVEFGLMRTPQGLRIYGAGIASSCEESMHALESDAPGRIAFTPSRAAQTAYRVDDLQPLYMVIDGFQELLDLAGAGFETAPRGLERAA
jgi:phenylalanine-4-hydroxylase